jgi:3-hydroxyacyl-CoA dehydrogenase
MQISNVTIVGAGTMGNGIAHVFSLAGYNVTLVDIKQEFLGRALAGIKKNMERQIKKEKITQQEMDQALKRITTSLSIDDAKDSQVVIEAVNEDLNEYLKKHLRGVTLELNSSTIEKRLGKLNRGKEFLWNLPKSSR